MLATGVLLNSQYCSANELKHIFPSNNQLFRDITLQTIIGSNHIIQTSCQSGTTIQPIAQGGLSIPFCP